MERKADRRKKLQEAVFLIILALYPLRHITWGLDLWDTGYNYANFQYMGLEHMDSMWLFSTYLANAAGWLLTKLPLAEGLVGMNFYTGLFVSLLALLGYFFCTRKLEIPGWVVFLGEITAVSLCWCPTALLYNYLTYVLFFLCVALLYEGLYRQRRLCLFAAGVCLGVNVFVRFSNLPQAAMILAVWVYAVIEGRENPEGKRRAVLKQALSHTGWCFFGYLTALLAIGGYLDLHYGMGAYVEGIKRLFAMTDNATDYKAASMLFGLVGTYVENLYWAVRIGAIAAAGLLFFAVVKKLFWRYEGLAKGLWVLVSAAMVGWLYFRGFCSLEFYSYGAILRPGVLFLMLTMLLALLCIFRKNSLKQEKLISGLVLLMVLLTSIGSNNGVYPSLNNLFIAAPYTLWQCLRFFQGVKEHKLGRGPLRGVVLSAWPLKGLLAGFLSLFLFQSLVFGACFVFAEATGVQDISAEAANNEILRGVRMSPERAEQISSVSQYVKENGLKGKEVILYGQIPALSYYLQMPSAFNPWSDLRSFSPEAMEEALAKTGEELLKSGERPVIILEKQYAEYRAGGEEALRGLGLSQKRIDELVSDRKWEALQEFMEEFSYEETFSNGKFYIWE